MVGGKEAVIFGYCEYGRECRGPRTAYITFRWHIENMFAWEAEWGRAYQPIIDATVKALPYSGRPFINRNGGNIHRSPHWLDLYSYIDDCVVYSSIIDEQHYSLRSLNDFAEHPISVNHREPFNKIAHTRMNNATPCEEHSFIDDFIICRQGTSLRNGPMPEQTKTRDTTRDTHNSQCRNDSALSSTQYGPEWPMLPPLMNITHSPRSAYHTIKLNDSKSLF